MKYLMLIGDNFEDVEAIGTLDVLVRGGEEVTLASMMNRKEVTTKLGNKLVDLKLIQDIDISLYDALIIPGGPGSFKILAFIPLVDQIIKYFVDNEKLVCAICAAPMLVGRNGYYKDKNYTVHPGFENQIIGGNYLKDQGVVQDGRFISAKSMYYSLEFGFKIYAYFHGYEASEQLRKTCQGE